MANLWQFFGLPEPDGTSRLDKPKAVEKSPPEEAVKDGDVPEQSPPEAWKGPVTPDGDGFHDLGDTSWSSSSTEPSSLRGLRYVTPDEKYRLPLEGMEDRLVEGDILIVDLRKLVHMDAHQNACRRVLRELSDTLRLPAFALDDEERILLMPGAGITIDIHNHSLGLAPLMPST